MFTYIRKPVRPRGALGQGCEPARGASALRGAAGGAERPERSPRRPQRSARQGRTVPASSASGKGKKTAGGENGEAGMSGGSSQLGCGGVGVRRGSERGLPFQVPFPVERLVGSVRAAGQSGRCCGSSSRNLSDIPCAPKSDAPSFYCRDSQTFLALMERRCEPRLEIKLRCFGLLAEALQIRGVIMLVYLGKEVLEMFVIWYFLNF